MRLPLDRTRWLARVVHRMPAVAIPQHIRGVQFRPLSAELVHTICHFPCFPSSNSFVQGERML